MYAVASRTTVLMALTSPELRQDDGFPSDKRRSGSLTCPGMTAKPPSGAAASAAPGGRRVPGRQLQRQDRSRRPAEGGREGGAVGEGAQGAAREGAADGAAAGGDRRGGGRVCVPLNVRGSNNRIEVSATSPTPFLSSAPQQSASACSPAQPSGRCATPPPAAHRASACARRAASRAATA